MKILFNLDRFYLKASLRLAADHKMQMMTLQEYIKINGVCFTVPPNEKKPLLWLQLIPLYCVILTSLVKAD